MGEYNKKVIVLGMGKTGVAVSEFLRKKGAFVQTFDDMVSFDKDLFCKSYDYAVISPGIPLTNPAVTQLKQSGVPVLSEIDLAYIECSSKHIFAVSGTNGKTTTCTILHKMLSTVGRSHLLGNVGVPWIGQVDKIKSKDFITLEISSFQIEQSQVFKPEIAALTNVGEDHLDRHLTAENYQSIKLSLLEKAAVKVVNLGDPVQRGIERAVTYSTTDPAADCYLSGRTIYFNGKKYRLPHLSRGAAFDADFLCAFTVASTYCGVKKSFLSVYDKVKLPLYRCQYIGKLCGAEVFNDSKGTNIDATLFAVKQLSKDTALMLGGSDKGEDYSRLFSGLGEHVKRIYLCGANAKQMYLAAEGKIRGKCVVKDSLDDCVSDFVCAPLSVLLFSPASASFDRFKNYEERGACFNEIVAKYADIHSRR